jgi:hypothetical protein
MAQAARQVPAHEGPPGAGADKNKQQPQIDEPGRVGAGHRVGAQHHEAGDQPDRNPDEPARPARARVGRAGWLRVIGQYLGSVSPDKAHMVG